MTYRKLLLFLEADAKSREDGDLDMPVIVRLEDEDGDMLCGWLHEALVDPGHTDSDALLLDASQNKDSE